MPKRASLDLDQFKVTLPKPTRDPLESIIPTEPINSIPLHEQKKPTVDSVQSSYHAIMQASYPDSIVEVVRKAVKYTGKDAFFGRFTPEEKTSLADIAYAYKRKGTKTSENEIARIAVNFIAHDYRENGKGSILSRVLDALNK